MDKYLRDFKNKHHHINYNFNYKNLITKVLLSIILFLCCLIYTNKSDTNLLILKENIFDKSLPFNHIKKIYEKYFGSPIPIKKESTTVFKGNFIYKDKRPYKEGTSFLLSDKSLVNNFTSGVVVFIGPKDNYGNTIIIQGVDGYDIWYGNMENISLKLYDYVEKDTVIGNTIDEHLYLVIKKGKDIINYEDYKY